MRKHINSNRFLKLILIAILIISLVACSSSIPRSMTESNILSEKYILETLLSEKLVLEGVISEEQLVELRLQISQIIESYNSEEVLIEELQIEVIKSEDLKAYISELDNSVAEYDIDWNKVIAQYAIGTAIIVITGILTVAFSVHGNAKAAFVFLSAFIRSKNFAFIGEEIGSVIGSVYSLVQNGDNIDSLIKYSIEGAATGFMWGAITGATIGIVEGNIGYKNLTPNSIGKLGEDKLSNLYQGESQKSFNTSDGIRRVDQFSNGVARESKVGSVVKKIELIIPEVMKDKELIVKGMVESVEWHFWRSPKTGFIGPTQQLYTLLIESGIKVIIHYTVRLH